MSIAIIDFPSSDPCRASFGYDGYILYSYLKSRGVDVVMYEDLTPYKMELIDKAKKHDEYIFCLWNYSQINAINWAGRILCNGTKSFVGYKPFEELVSIPFWSGWDDNVVTGGLINFPDIFPEMEYGLLNDCDLHINPLEPDTRSVKPIFTSYGCPNKCGFCPIPAVRKGMNPRSVLNLGDVYDLITKTVEAGFNVHFCDEDFFMSEEEVERYVNFMIKLQLQRVSLGFKKFKWIALASVPTLYKYLVKHGEQPLIDSGCYLIEVGLEATDLEQRKLMNKTGDSNQTEYILEHSKHIDKFWLMITFFLGETITKINKVGDFLIKNGTPQERLGDRLVTASNRGGLGQFFQPYHGTKLYEKLDNFGIMVKDKMGNRVPGRLIPSFIPYSFLDCKPVQVSTVLPEEKIFFKVYNIDYEKYDSSNWDTQYNCQTVGEIIEDNNFDLVEFCLYTALMARFNHIVEKETK